MNTPNINNYGSKKKYTGMTQNNSFRKSTIYTPDDFDNQMRQSRAFSAPTNSSNYLLSSSPNGSNYFPNYSPNHSPNYSPNYSPNNSPDYSPNTSPNQSLINLSNNQINYVRNRMKYYEVEVSDTNFSKIFKHSLVKKCKIDNFYYLNDGINEDIDMVFKGNMIIYNSSIYLNGQVEIIFTFIRKSVVNEKHQVVINCNFINNTLNGEYDYNHITRNIQYYTYYNNGRIFDESILFYNYMNNNDEIIINLIINYFDIHGKLSRSECYFVNNVMEYNILQSNISKYDWSEKKIMVENKNIFTLLYIKDLNVIYYKNGNNIYNINELPRIYSDDWIMLFKLAK